LGECLTLVPRDAVVLLASYASRWRIGFPSALMGSAKLGMAFGNPLPPLGRTLFCQSWPFSVSPDAVYGYTALTAHPEGRAEQSGRFWPFDLVRTVSSEEKNVLVNGEKFCRAVSAPHAAAVAGFIRGLVRMPHGSRDAAIAKALRDSFDTRMISVRTGEWLGKERGLRFLGNAVFAMVFAVCPLVAATWGLWSTWPYLMAGLLALMIATAVALARAHRAVYPAATGDRVLSVALAATVPTISIRACDYLSRDLLAGFHPLAAAHALLTPEEFRSFARRTLLDAREPIRPACPSTEPSEVECENWYRGRLREEMESFLAAQGIATDELTSAPAPRDAQSAGYCPRCEGQFTNPEGTCGNCGGIPIRAFE
jgi:hypothetical protein